MKQKQNNQYSQIITMSKWEYQKLNNEHKQFKQYITTTATTEITKKTTASNL